MQDRASPTDEALAEAHARLLKDGSLQFDRVGFERPDIRPPGWLHWIGDALHFIAPALIPQPDLFGSPAADIRIEKAACMMADSAGRYHPDHRAEMAYDQALRGQPLEPLTSTPAGACRSASWCSRWPGRQGRRLDSPRSSSRR